MAGTTLRQKYGEAKEHARLQAPAFKQKAHENKLYMGHVPIHETLNLVTPQHGLRSPGHDTIQLKTYESQANAKITLSYHE